MSCNDIQLFLIDYLDKQLDDKTRKQVEEHLHTCPGCSKELEQLMLLQDNIDAEEMIAPPATLRMGFMHTLEEEAGKLAKQQQTGTKKPGATVISLTVGGLAWRAAAAVIILAVGIGIGYKVRFDGQQGSIAQKPTKQDAEKKVLVNMLDDESPSQRMEAVNYADELGNKNKNVISVLFSTLNTDKSANVRVAAVFALEKYTDDKAVLDSMVASLAKQTEPIVQILLIDILSSRKVTKAIKPIQDILSNDKTIKEVKEAAEKGLRKI